MSVGIAGRYELSGAPAAIARLAAANGDGITEDFRDGPLALSVRVRPWFGSAVATDQARGLTVVLVGAAYSDGGLLSPRMLLEAFADRGAEAWYRLNGAYVAIAWEAKAQRLTFVTDGLGIEKLYIHRDSRTFRFAGSLSDLLADPSVPRAIDELAVAQFLATSHLLDTRSLIEGVSVLSPATVTTVEGSLVRTQCYWRPSIRPDESLSLDEWADRIRERLRGAMERRHLENGWIYPVSAGLDSRAIGACLTAEERSAANAVTFGPAYCYDVRYGRAVARRLGMPHRRITLPTMFFRDYLEQGLRMTDGEVSIEALPMLSLLGQAAPGTALVSGFLGDCLSGSHLPPLEDCRSEQARLDRIWEWLYVRKGHSDDHLRWILNPDRYARVAGQAFELMRQSLAEADAGTLEERALLLELHHRQSRYISYHLRVLASEYRMQAPFADPDVIDCWLQLPLPYRRGQRAYRHMLLRHAPHLARIREGKSNRPLDAAGNPLGRAALSRFRAALPAGAQWRARRLEVAAGRAVVSLSGGWLGPCDRTHYVRHDESIRRNPDWFRAQVSDGELLDGWFDRRALHAMLDEHLARRRDHSVRLNNVIAFMNWRRLFGL